MEAVAAAASEFSSFKLEHTARIPTKTGKEYSYQYADLTTLHNATKPALLKHGLFIFQEPNTIVDDNGLLWVIVACTITHEAGAWLQFDGLPMPVYSKSQGRPPDEKDVGSVITYARRYQLSAILGLSAEQDTDGIASAPPMSDGHKPQAAKAQPDSKRKPITDGQKKKLHAIGKKFYGDEWNAKRKELVEWVTTGNAESSDQLTTKEASTLIDGIQTKLDKQKAEALLAEQA